MVSDSNPQYTVLARRFRPQSFDEVVGQEHVGQSIRNAIRSNRVAHAYLFTGARGVGKTSTARIFAKALNCPNVQDGVPCNECDVCRRIGAGHDVDVLEIDGASNRGIDDIRQLRANVNVRSMRSPYKVYIIDEVHMLTKEAFNALLKTLEEPPPNVKFVFCTTEPNKVPDTILSRCQRFDFGTIAQESIAARLKQIAQAEGKQVEDDAVELIARRAAGSMRDSQSLFDQLLAFGGEQITAADVHQLLGTAADDRLTGLIEACIAGQPGEALQLLETALLEGVQIGSFSDQLLDYLRDLLVTAAGAESVPLSAVAESSRTTLQEQAGRWGMQTISAAMQILADTKGRMQRVTYGRALMELALVRMASLEQLDEIAGLVRQVASAPPVSGRPAPAGGAGQPRSAAMRNTLAAKKNSEVSPPPASPVPAAPEETASSLPEIEFSPETLSDFWSQLVSNLPDTLSGHLRNSSRQAISGPNGLEILFPRSYRFSKTYCERREPLQKLSGLASEMAGRKIECQFREDESAPAPKPATRKAEPAALQRRRPSSVENDPFVQHAVSIFGGQVVDVRPVVKQVTPAGEPPDE
jgi:DNA polymerase III subunit gamma/tau